MTRRQVLLGAGVLLAGGVSACDTSSGGPTPGPTVGSPTASPTTAKDAALRSAAAQRVRVLLAAYDGVLTGRGPDDPAHVPLMALRADHVAHLEALTGDIPTSAPTTDPPASAPLPSDVPPTTQAPAVPPPGPVPVADLLATERLAEAGNAGDVGAASRELGRLLASIAACEASHEVALGALATP